MKRRNFLGSLLAIPFTVKALTITEKQQDVVIEKIPSVPYEGSGNGLWYRETDRLESKLLTNDFFTYIKWNPTKFDWRQMVCPADVFDGIPVIAKARRLKIIVSDEKKYSALSMVERKRIIKNIIEELENEFKVLKLKQFYFYSLVFTSRIYNPDFTPYMPMCGIIIRYAMRSTLQHSFY